MPNSIGSVWSLRMRNATKADPFALRRKRSTTRPARRETRRVVYESEVGRFRYSRLRQSLFGAYDVSRGELGAHGRRRTSQSSAQRPAPAGLSSEVSAGT